MAAQKTALRKVEFKDGILANWGPYSKMPQTDRIFWWIVDMLGDVVVTSAHRSRKIHGGDSGIHMAVPLRAFDLRSYIYSDPFAVQDEINANWIYDPYRPQFNVCVYHDTGRGVHFHVQTHPNTIRR